mgnify:CR=1 FL=1
MDRSKRFTNFFHNFVVMKKSVNFLPENKRNDLKQLVDLVRRNIKDVGMVILYGSYARNTHVDYDQRIEFGASQSGRLSIRCMTKLPTLFFSTRTDLSIPSPNLSITG